MKDILALDTSTDACSAAWRSGGDVISRFQLIPRQHNHLLFAMMQELLPDGASDAGIQALAYGQGPGSFTGLRIAASAVQGLAYTLDVPVAGVSTLACLAQGSLRRGAVADDELVLTLLDARINEVYWGLYRFDGGVAMPCIDDQVSAPGEIPGDLLAGPAVALGSGLLYQEALPDAVRAHLSRSVADQWPDSIDLLPLADRQDAAGALLDARAVQPVYLRNEIHWKKLSEQGPRRG
jgi:tRNA threonylcarbamoyladenosine biosynthesis protein TsaB